MIYANALNFQGAISAKCANIHLKQRHVRIHIRVDEYLVNAWQLIIHLWVAKRVAAGGRRHGAKVLSQNVNERASEWGETARVRKRFGEWK